MKRALGILVVLLVALVVVPPLWFSLFPGDPPPELPAADRRIAVGDGVHVSAVVRGSGKPVVLVHGLPGSGHDWQPLTDLLARRGHAVIAYDRVGYGRSDPRPDDDFTPDGSGRDLLGLLESEGLTDVTVVGWSYGGATAIRAAIRDRSRIGRIVLIGSAGPWANAPEPPAYSAVLFSGPVMRWMTAVPPLGRGVQSAFSVQAFSPEPVPEGWADLLAANFAQPNTVSTYMGEGDRFAWGDDLDPSSIPRPILVISGAEDALVPLEVAEGLHQRAQNSQLVVIEGGGHMLPITRPDEIAKQIAAFVHIR